VVHHFVTRKALNLVFSAVPDVQVPGVIFMLISKSVTVQTLHIRHEDIRVYLLVVTQLLAAELCGDKSAVVDLHLTLLQNLGWDIVTISALCIHQMSCGGIGS